MKLRRGPIFSLIFSLLLLLSSALAFAQSSSSLPWSKIFNEGREEIIKELNLTKVPYVLSLVSSRNLTLSPLLASQGKKVRMRMILLWYNLTLKGKNKTYLPVVVSFSEKGGKLSLIGVQVMGGDLHYLYSEFGIPFDLISFPMILAQIPRAGPVQKAFENLTRREGLGVYYSEIPSLIRSKLNLTPQHSVVKIFTKVLAKYSKVWWHFAPAKGITKGAIACYDWAITRYLSEVPFYKGKFFRYVENASPVIFPNFSSKTFATYEVVHCVKSPKGRLLEGWKIVDGMILGQGDRLSYINLGYGARGPWIINNTLMSIPELIPLIKKAFFEVLLGISKEENCTRMQQLIEKLMTYGEAGGEKYSVSTYTYSFPLYKKGAKEKEEKITVRISGEFLQAYLRVDNWLTIYPHHNGTIGMLWGVGTFFFNVNDWSYFFPKEVVNYGGPSEALKVARESLGKEKGKIISQRVILEKGILWGNKIYRVYFVRTEVKKGVSYKKVYISSVFLGKLLKEEFLGKELLSTPQVVTLDWYYVFGPAILVGGALGGIAYLRYRKRRKER